MRSWDSMGTFCKFTFVHLNAESSFGLTRCRRRRQIWPLKTARPDLTHFKTFLLHSDGRRSQRAR